MTSILDLNSGSSDSEDDCDYVPPANANLSGESEDDISEDDGEEPSPKKVKIDLKQNKDQSEENKKSKEEIWKSFLQGVESTPYAKSNGKANSTTSSKSASNEPKIQTDDEKLNNETNGITKNVLEKDDSCKDEKSATVDSNDTEKSSNVLDTKLKPALSTTSSKDNHLERSQSISLKSSLPRAGGGVSSILGALANKGKKMTVLEKSLQDWKSFKTEEGIDKDLETYNKGRLGFVERQRFLQRSDLRTFENEKQARLFGKKR